MKSFWFLLTPHFLDLFETHFLVGAWQEDDCYAKEGTNALFFLSCQGKYGKSRYRKNVKGFIFPPVTGFEMGVTVRSAKATGLWQQCLQRGDPNRRNDGFD